MKSRSGIGAIILIVLGTLFLLSNLGILPHFGVLLAKWWPVILIAVGVSILLRKNL